MKLFILAALVAGIATGTIAHGQTSTPEPSSTPVQIAATISERRERAFASMLEGERFAWVSQRTRSQTIMVSNATLAKAAFLRAISFDPTLAEAYTAIAELSLAVPPGDVAVGLDFAARAAKIDKNNFGARRILARLNTLKSGLGGDQFDVLAGNTAIAQWKEVTRLDPRNAEGWAFLAAFYDQTKMRDERIDALKKWLASAQPVEIGFYGNIMGRGESLMPEAASIKLGGALVDAGKMNEAVEVLSLVVADAPDDALAIILLGQALTTADAKSSTVAIQSLQQASYANANNLVLSILLAKAQARAGKIEDAVLGLGRKAKVTAATDVVGAASLQVAAGDIFADAGMTQDAVQAFEKAFETRGIDKTALIAADEREFAILVFGKIIQTYKQAKRPADINATIERARRLLGQKNLFADR